MNQPFRKTELNNGVIVEFFTQGNRYFGDFHRIEISVVVKIPLVKDSLAKDLQEFAASYPEFILYERKLERMGVATGQVEEISHELVDDFIRTVAGYLEKPSFAEGLLRKEMQQKTKRTTYY